GMHLDLVALTHAFRAVDLLTVEVHHDHVLGPHLADRVHFVAAALDHEFGRIVWQTHAHVANRVCDSGGEAQLAKDAGGNSDLVFDVIESAHFVLPSCIAKAETFSSWQAAKAASLDHCGLLPQTSFATSWITRSLPHWTSSVVLPPRPQRGQSAARSMSIYLD